MNADGEAGNLAYLRAGTYHAAKDSTITASSGIAASVKLVAMLVDDRQCRELDNAFRN